jgi:hypothetical protein
MGCLAGILNILIWIIVVVGVVAIARILLNYVAVPPVFIQIANVVLWVVVAIAVVYVLGDLLFCAWPVGHFR